MDLKKAKIISQKNIEVEEKLNLQDSNCACEEGGE